MKARMVRSALLLTLMLGALAAVFFVATLEVQPTRPEPAPRANGHDRTGSGGPSGGGAVSGLDIAAGRRETAQSAHQGRLLALQSIDPARVRRERPEMDMTEELQPRTAWHGPLPETVHDLPDTPAVSRALSELTDLPRLDKGLALLGLLRRCVDPQARSEGGVFVELWFKVESRSGLARGDRVELLQSTLAEADDLVFLDCAEKSLRTISFQLTREEFPGEWPETYLWRETFSVPVRNDAMYPWLLGEQDSSRR